jgi:hypothetical protein
MPTVGHTPTRDNSDFDHATKGKYDGVALTESSEKDHRLLAIVTTSTRSTTAPTPQQHNEGRNNPSDTPERPTIKARAAT